MRSTNFWRKARTLIAAVLPALFLPLSSPAQTSGVLSVLSPPKISAKRNEVVVVKLNVQLRGGYHVNSNTPSEDYLIPLRLTWDPVPLQVGEVLFPSPRMEKYQFSATPLSVFTGDFEILTRMKVPANATPGMGILSGKLRYQACNDKACLPPKNLEVRVPYDLR